VAAIERRGSPGIYNLAASDPVSLSEAGREVRLADATDPRALVRLGGDVIARFQDRLP
jgi:hypothetical protein